MNFAFPAVLWALPVAALPLVLHLLSRRRARRTPFPDLSFLKKVQARALARTRLKQWLLIAARCLLLACLIVSYAGPVVRGGSPGGGGGAGEDALDLVLLMDASYSMTATDGGRSRFELAREQGAALLRTLRAGDRAAVAVFTDRLETPPGPPALGDAQRALEALSRAQPLPRPTDYAPAVAAARELLSRDERRRRAVVLLSDGARHGLRAPLDLGRGITWLGLDFGAPPANAYVASAAPSREAGVPRLTARVAGLTEPAVSVELRLSGRRADSAGARAAGGEAAASLALPVPAGRAEPAWSGEARIRADALALDDVYYFSIRRPARRRVLVLYGDPAFFRAPNAGYFLKELLGGAREGLLDLEAEFAELHRLADAKLSDYQAVVLADARDVPAAHAAALERYVREGGGLWVLPSASSAEGALRALDPWLPAAFGPVVGGETPGLVLGSSADPAPWRSFELGKIAFARYFLLSIRPKARVLFKSASGYPLLVAGERGRGRVAVFASSLDAGWTNLALKPAFAPLVRHVLGELAPSGSREESLETVVGRPIARAWAADEAAPARARLRGPDGSSQTLFVRERRVESAPAAAPGLYELTEEGSGRRHVYAVNADRSAGESDLAPLSPAPWTTVPAAELNARFRSEVFGRDARRAFLAAAAGLLLLEMALALPAAAAAAVLLAVALPVSAQQATGDRFVWTQLKLGPQWDPYPTAAQEALEMLSTVTSVLSWPERRVIALEDKSLFFSPVVVLAGREAPPPLTEEQSRDLRAYLSAGGLLWIEDVSGAAASSFDRWVRRELPRALPEAELASLPSEHVVFRTFFLLKGAPVGRVFVAPALEGVTWGGRTAVIYSRNDLLGVWPKDAMGKPLLACVPGGETQRHAARKLALNILMYGLTGNYKADAVHQPFLLQKMRSGAP